jgi:hypothetical protein
MRDQVEDVVTGVNESTPRADLVLAERLPPMLDLGDLAFVPTRQFGGPSLREPRVLPQLAQTYARASRAC